MERYRLPLTREVPIPSDEEAQLPQPIAYYYLASDVDAFMTAAGLTNWATQAERIAELQSIIAGLLDSTDPYIRVKARQAIGQRPRELMER